MIDLVLYAGEADMLALRAATLAGHGVRHAVVEGLETFSGLPRVPSLLRDPRLAYLRESLAYHIPPRQPAPNPWVRESYQRTALGEHLIGVPDDTLVLVGDIDEIPAPQDLPRGPGDLPETEWGRMGVFAQSHRAYDARNVRAGLWHGTVCTTARIARQLGCEGARRLRLSVPVIGGGWHFTHMGSIARLREKIAAFSHQEYHTPAVLAALDSRRAAGTDPFGRDEERYTFQSDALLPQPLVDNPAAYPSLWRDAL